MSILKFFRFPFCIHNYTAYCMHIHRSDVQEFFILFHLSVSYLLILYALLMVIFALSCSLCICLQHVIPIFRLLRCHGNIENVNMISKGSSNLSLFSKFSGIISRWIYCYLLEQDYPLSLVIS